MFLSRQYPHEAQAVGVRQLTRAKVPFWARQIMTASPLTKQKLDNLEK